MSGLSVRAAVLDSDPSFSKHDCLKYDLNVSGILYTEALYTVGLYY